MVRCGFIRFQANFTWISGNFRRFHLLKFSSFGFSSARTRTRRPVASVVSGEAVSDVSDDGESGAMGCSNFSESKPSACRYLTGNWGVNYQEYIQVTTGCC